MHKNNFAVLRHLAALAVLASHSVALTTGQEATEIGMRLTHGQMTVGHLAVTVFFILSGYLITLSWQRRPVLGAFAAARAGRLLPGLAASVLLCALVAGPLLTILPAADYATSPETARFIGWNLSLLGFAGPLPGVFTTNPLVAVNGSLWTLHYEAACYAMVAGLGLLGLLRRWVVLALLAAALIATRLWWGGPLVEFGTCFVGGMAMALWRPPIRVWALLLCAVVLVGMAMTGGFRLACATAGAYVVVAAALARPWSPIGGNGSDYSYGVYLWAFPVQQLIVSWGVAHWAVNIAISLPVVLACAWLSWQGIEGPVLRWQRTRRPVAAPAWGTNTTGQLIHQQLDRR